MVGAKGGAARARWPAARPTSRSPTAADAWIDGGPRWSAPDTRRRACRPRRRRRGRALTPVPRERPAARRARAGPARRGRPRRRPGPGHRPGRLGQDAGADRAAAPPARRPRLRARGACSPSPTTSRPSTSWRRGTRRFRPRVADAQLARLLAARPSTAGRAPACSTSGRCAIVDRRCSRSRRQRRANTDPIGPYLEALTAQSGSGCATRPRSRTSATTCPGLADGFGPLPRSSCAAAGAIDFDEQIYGALEALLRDGAFRRRVQPEHRHLLVDEFQDLTPAHVLLIRLLAMPGARRIRRRRRRPDDLRPRRRRPALPRRLRRASSRAPRRRRSRSTTAARRRSSTAPATCSATTAVRVPKRSVPRPAADPDPGCARDPRPARRRGGDDARRARPRLARRAGGRAGGRRRPRPRQLAAARAPGGAVRRPASRSPRRCAATMLERTGTAAALAWLRVARRSREPAARATSTTIRRRPSRGFPHVDQQVARELPLARRTCASSAAGSTTSGSPARSTRLADDIGMLAGLAAAGGTTRELLEAVRDRIGLGGAMEMLDGSKGSEATASHLDDLEGLIQVADLHPDPGGLRAVAAGGARRRGGGRGRQLSTVHRVKGREWDRVAVFGADRRADAAPAQRDAARRSAASSTSRSRGRGTAASSSPMPSGRRRSWPRSAARRPSRRRSRLSAPTRSAPPPRARGGR